jgi:hypothetical protein
VTSTGCVGYVTEKSFESLLLSMTQGRSPWTSNFVLQMFPWHCQSKSVHFATTSEPDFVAINFPAFFRVDLSGSMAAPSI